MEQPESPPTAAPIRLCCPHCGGTDLVSFEATVTAYHGIRWYQVPDGTVVADRDHISDSEPDIQLYDLDDLTCRDCDQIGLHEADLVPVGTTPSPASPSPAQVSNDSQR